MPIVEGSSQKIELREETAGCSVCVWTFPISIPADTLPGSDLDMKVMVKLNNAFALHNIRVHNGQAKMIGAGSTF